MTSQTELDMTGQGHEVTTTASFVVLVTKANVEWCIPTRCIQLHVPVHNTSFRCSPNAQMPTNNYNDVSEVTNSTDSVWSRQYSLWLHHYLYDLCIPVRLIPHTALDTLMQIVPRYTCNVISGSWESLQVCYIERHVLDVVTCTSWRHGCWQGPWGVHVISKILSYLDRLCGGITFNIAIDSTNPMLLAYLLQNVNVTYSVHYTTVDLKFTFTSWCNFVRERATFHGILIITESFCEKNHWWIFACPVLNTKQVLLAYSIKWNECATHILTDKNSCGPRGPIGSVS